MRHGMARPTAARRRTALSPALVAASAGRCVAGRAAQRHRVGNPSHSPVRARPRQPAAELLDRRYRCGLYLFGQPFRSEEHTSELQSLMRISYAVFCLKKKKETTQHTNKNQ